MNMNVSVIGCGRWGSFLSWYQNRIGNNVLVYGIAGDPSYEILKKEGKNDYLVWPKEIALTTSLKQTLEHADTIIISIGSQHLRSLMQDITKLDYQGKTFILCMKGLEVETGKRLTEIFKEYAGDNAKVAVWVGPGHVQSFTSGEPNCMIIDCEDDETTKRLVSYFNSDLIRFYYGSDIIGTEVGAATKNVMGIAAGILDGMKLSSMKGALMARGVREISRLVKAMGGNELTPYGLSHLGDYEATLFSKNSHNRKYGEDIITGEKFDKLAEGVYTTKALMKLSEIYKIELPISSAVHDIIFGHEKAENLMNRLLCRPNKEEF